MSVVGLFALHSVPVAVAATDLLSRDVRELRLLCEQCGCRHMTYGPHSVHKQALSRNELLRALSVAVNEKKASLTKAAASGYLYEPRPWEILAAIEAAKKGLLETELLEPELERAELKVEQLVLDGIGREERPGQFKTAQRHVVTRRGEIGEARRAESIACSVLLGGLGLLVVMLARRSKAATEAAAEAKAAATAQHGPWRPAATDRSRKGGGHAGASSRPSPAGMTPTLEAVLSTSPSTEVPSKATQYARTMEAAGFGDVQSLLQCDDGDLDEMRQELEANGVPQMAAVSIRSMFSADTLSEAIQAMSVAAPAAPNTTPVDISATPAETRLSGYCFEVEDESAPGGWLRVQDCTAAMMRVLMGDGLQQFTMSGWKKYEAFRDPATSKLKQRNCKYGVRLTRCPPCALPIC